MTAGDRSTVVWNRSAAFASSRTSLTGSAKSLIDVDLRLYDGGDGTQDSSSASTVNNVEQVKATSALSTGVVKVKRAGSFPSGQTTLDYAVASAGTLTAVTGPDLQLADASTPSVAQGGGQVTVSVSLENDGGLTAFAPSLVLGLPTGWTLAPGETAAQTVGDTEPTSGGGAARTASWDVIPVSDTRTDTLKVNATSSSFGESFAAVELQIDVDVDATAPFAVPGAPIVTTQTTVDGTSVDLDGSGSSDSSGQPLTEYAWDADDDGGFDDASGATPSVDFAVGVHTVTLRVTDHVGNTGSNSTQVTVLDAPPVAAAGQDRSVNEGDTVQFDGTSSSDLDAGITHVWSFGDGQFAGGSTPSHVFGDEGQYTVTLTVTDAAEQTAADTLVVTVANVAPTVDAGGDATATEGDAVSFDGTAFDPGDDVLTIEWDFGDGMSSDAIDVTHTYQQDGAYFATLTVDDGDGGSDLASRIIGVLNAPPEFTLPGALTVDVGHVLSLDVSATDPSPVDQAALTLDWRVLDGTTAVASGSGTAVSWPADRRLDGVLEVTVSDDDDATVRTALLTAVTPSMDDVLPDALGDADLAPKVEKKAIRGILKAWEDVQSGKTKKRNKAVKRLRKVQAAFRDAGISDGPLVWKMTALVSDLAAGVIPQDPDPFVVPEEPGSTAEMLAALPSAVSDAKTRKKLGKALLALRFAQRTEASSKKIAKTVKKAVKAAGRLPEGDVADWFVLSLGL